MNQRLKDMLARVETWPDAMQAELLDMLTDLEAAQAGDDYVATPEELAAIDEADQSGVATPDEVAAAFAKFRS